MYKLNMEGGYFSVPLQHSSSKNLNKIAENANVCTEKDKYLDSDIFMTCL